MDFCPGLALACGLVLVPACGGGSGGSGSNSNSNSASVSESGSESGGDGSASCPGDPDNVGEPRAPDLAEPISTEVVARFNHVRAGDVTGDGLDDIAIVELTEGGIFILPGDGAGGFGDVVDLSQSAMEGTAAGLEVADLDGDGTQDVALGFRLIDSSVPGVEKVYWGGPTFPADVTVLEGDVLFNAAATVASGDFDGDGIADLVGEAAVGMFVSYGLGNREFEAGQMLHEDDLVQLVQYAQAVDLDEDGRVEPIGNTVQAGGFLGFRIYEVGADRSVGISMIPNIPFPGTLAFFEDLNLDGAPDIIISGSAGVYVAWNEGQGQFDPYNANVYCTTTEDSPLAATSPFVGIADLDGDGQLDVAAAEASDHELVFLHGRTEDRHLREFARLPAGEAEPVAVVIGEFDGAGRPDLAVVHDHSGSLAGPFPLLVHLNQTP